MKSQAEIFDNMVLTSIEIILQEKKEGVERGRGLERVSTTPQNALIH